MSRVGATSWCSHWPKALMFLKLMKLRLGLFFTMFVIAGYLSTGDVQWYVLVIGTASLPGLLAFDRAVNIYTDRSEDCINNPYRVNMAETIGYRAIGALGLGLYLAIITGCLLAAIFLNFTAALLAIFAVHLSLFYSLGLRLKRHPILSLLATSIGVAICPFTGGWALGQPLVSISPVIFVIGYHRFVHGAIQTFPMQKEIKQQVSKPFSIALWPSV